MYEDKKDEDKQMGFLIFAYRKLCLQRDINQKTFRQMNLSSRQLLIHSKIEAMEQAKAAIQTAFTISMSSLSAEGASVFTSNTQSNTKQMLDFQTQLQNTTDEAAKATINKQMEALLSQNKLKQESEMQKYTAFTQNIAMAQQAGNSIFAMVDKAELDGLHAEDTQITLQMKSLESQLTLENAELQSVEKAEGEAAKNAAPKFGLG